MAFDRPVLRRYGRTRLRRPNPLNRSERIPPDFRQSRLQPGPVFRSADSDLALRRPEPATAMLAGRGFGYLARVLRLFLRALPDAFSFLRCLSHCSSHPAQPLLSLDRPRDKFRPRPAVPVALEVVVGLTDADPVTRHRYHLLHPVP